MPAKRRKSQKGRGVASDIHSFVKSNQLISKGLSMLPHPLAQGASIVARQLGYGHHPAMNQVGGGIFSDIGGGLGNLAHGLFGGGKRKVHRRNVIKV